MYNLRLPSKTLKFKSLILALKTLYEEINDISIGGSRAYCVQE